MLNSSRNLYRILGNQRVVAFITAASPEAAIQTYRAQELGGGCEDIKAERLTIGYPEDVCQIYPFHAHQ